MAYRPCKFVVEGRDGAPDQEPFPDDIRRVRAIIARRADMSEEFVFGEDSPAGGPFPQVMLGDAGGLHIFNQESDGRPKLADCPLVNIPPDELEQMVLRPVRADLRVRALSAHE